MCYSELCFCLHFFLFMFFTFLAVFTCHWPPEPFNGAPEETINLFEAPQSAKRGIEGNFILDNATLYHICLQFHMLKPKWSNKFNFKLIPFISLFGTLIMHFCACFYVTKLLVSVVGSGWSWYRDESKWK